MDLGKYNRLDLLNLGFVLGELNSNGTKLAFTFAERYLRLSKNDAFALALSSIENCLLLTGDTALRKAAIKENVKVHGLLWLFDQMEVQQVLSNRDLILLLTTWVNDPLIWLPRKELQVRISRLQQR